MNDPEQRLTRLLTIPDPVVDEPADEHFVASVMLEVAAAERRRRVILGGLTVIAAGLTGALLFGLTLAATAWREVASPLPQSLAAAVQLPTLGLVLLGSLLLLLARDPICVAE